MRSLTGLTKLVKKVIAHPLEPNEMWQFEGEFAALPS